jgi:hypothetical protein
MLTVDGRILTTQHGMLTADRGMLAVDLWAAPGGTQVRLRIFIEDNRAVSTFYECPLGTVYASDVIGAIRRC